MRLMRVVAALAAMAVLAGHELAAEQRSVTAPVTAVSAATCVANGGVVAVWRAADEPGVFHVRCASGVVLLAGNRYAWHPTMPSGSA